MFSDYKTPTSSSARGKSKDDAQWRLGWWDFHPLIESSQPPLQWPDGTIFTAHPTLPLVQAHISASSRFHLPSPPQIRILYGLPNLYKPPTVISACPDNTWLFAYFPGVDATPPLAVIWKKGSRADDWHVKEAWNFDPTGAVVTATWFGTEREWITDDNTGTLTRLPPLGPHNPLNSPTLLAVTQSHHLFVCYFGHYPNSIRTVSCRLTRNDIEVKNPHGRPPDDISYGPGGVRVCSKACIGLRYDDSLIFVATHSRILPCATERSAMYAMDLNSSITMPPPIPTDYDLAMDWESWGEESTIELCLVQFSSDSKSLSLSSQPLPAIHLSKGALAKMTFMCTIPIQSLLSQYGTDLIDSQDDDDKRGRVYLGTTILHLDDYNSTPRSELTLYSFSPSIPTFGKLNWTVQHEATRLFPSGVLSFFYPFREPAGQNKLCLFAGILHTSGSSRRQAFEVTVGHVVALKVPDLSDDEEWQPSLMVCPATSPWKDLPIITAISPNKLLVCTISPFVLSSPAAIHPLPTRIWKLGSAAGIGPTISHALAAAIRARRSVADLSSALSVPSVPLGHVSETLYNALTILDSSDHKMSETWAWDILGVAVEVYGMRLHRSGHSEDSGLLAAKWQTAHELCSLAACNTAFRECRVGDGYDPKAMWQLITLCTWIVNFLEKLMKDCIVSHANDTAILPIPIKVEEGDDLFGSVSPTSPEADPSIWEFPALLHLVQPYALNNLYAALKHVVLFHDRFRAIPAKDENTQIAKDVFLDLVESSGINLNGLESLLLEALQEAQVISEGDARRSLAQCQPTSPLLPILRNTVQRLANSEILDKALLFIKATDLVNGSTWIPTTEQEATEKERDVVSKAVLTRDGPIPRCHRCNGKSEIGTTSHSNISLRWRTWESAWAARCICGGVWYIPHPK